MNPRQRRRQVTWAFRSVRWDRLAAFALVLVGTVLRVARWASDRSLWLDEIFLANNLIGRSFWGLLQPLEHRQGAPPLFLWLEKGAIAAFGSSEMAMRLVPLVAGIASLPLVYLVGRALMGRGPALVALALLAVAEPPVYYSSEVKQYSTDLMVTLGVMWAFIRYQERPERRRAAVLGAVGVAAMFLSHPSVFVIGGGTLAIVLANRQSREALMRFAPLLLVWGGALVVNYLAFLRPLSREPGLRAYWQDAFMPWSLSGLPWLAVSLMALFQDYATLWLRWPVAGFLAALGGVAALARRPVALVFLLGPLLLALAAAALHRYPFSGRLVLFLVPVPVLLIAAVFAEQAGVRRETWAWRLLALARVAVLALVILPEAGRAAVHLVRPPGREEIEVVLARLAREARDGDAVYVYHGANAGYDYYGARYRWPAVTVVKGRNIDEDPEALVRDAADLLRARRGRLWVLYSHTPTGGSEDTRLRALLPPRVSAAIEARGAGAYLYEL